MGWILRNIAVEEMGGEHMYTTKESEAMNVEPKNAESAVVATPSSRLRVHTQIKAGSPGSAASANINRAPTLAQVPTAPKKQLDVSQAPRPH